MKFIYCIDDNFRNHLINGGFKFISHQNISGQETWIFENNNKLKFNNFEKNKYFYSNKLCFGR